MKAARRHDDVTSSPRDVTLHDVIRRSAAVSFVSVERLRWTWTGQTSIHQPVMAVSARTVGRAAPAPSHCHCNANQHAHNDDILAYWKNGVK